MSVTLKPLLWKSYEKQEKDDIWPKKVVGASLIFCQDTKRYFLIGGNFNAFENSRKNFHLNQEIISGVDKNIENFSKLDSEKISYLTGSVYSNGNAQTPRLIDVYILELYPEKKWYKVSTGGRVPKARSFHRSIYISIYKFY